MKYADKFPDMKPIFDVCENIMRGRVMKPCIICSNPTGYIEINYEAHFCSEECVAEMDRLAHEAIMKAGKVL